MLPSDKTSTSPSNAPFIDDLKQRCSNEPEFLQAVEEVMESLVPIARTN
jgi:hypothetical protein